MITLRQVKKFYNTYDKNKRLKAVDIDYLHIKQGEFVCLVGPSGCGKTSTLKLINQLILPEEGSIEIEGKKSPASNPLIWRRNIGYVVQNRSLFPHLTLLENIVLLAKVLKRDKKKSIQKAYDLMSLFGLDPMDYKDRYPSEMSGGQQQRGALARALIEDPNILLMDEPFGALDPINSQKIRTEFVKLNQKLKKTILLVTHNISSAFEMADQIVLMKEGSILQKGTEEELKKQPENLFVKNFLNKNPREPYENQ